MCDPEPTARTFAPPFDRAEPDGANAFQAGHAALILASHQRLTGRDLLPGGGTPDERAHRLYHAPFALLAHDRTEDPLFFYANLCAQRLFELPWQAIVRLPSRLSAEPLARAERERLLQRVAARGYIDDYSGVRVAASGRRFRIVGATVWNLVDAAGDVVGQAAAFAHWRSIGVNPRTAM